MDEHITITGRQAVPPDVWDTVKADYLAGLSGPDCCRRHGVSLSALRNRAAREGWRRSDQPWSPPQSLDPQDEGRLLEERIGGNLDLIEWGELSGVAEGVHRHPGWRTGAHEAKRRRCLSSFVILRGA